MPKEAVQTAQLVVMVEPVKAAAVIAIERKMPKGSSRSDAHREVLELGYDNARAKYGVTQEDIDDAGDSVYIRDRSAKS